MEEITFQKHIGLLIFSSLFLSLVLTPRTRGVAVLLGAVDAPDPRKIHAQKIPRLGGLGIAVSVIFLLFLSGKNIPLIRQPVFWLGMYAGRSV